VSDLRADAVTLLTGWAPPDAEQDRLRQHYLRHLSAYDDGLLRTRLPEHVTASALVTDPARSRVLLTLHARIGRWLQLGGHCEPGDTTLAGAALREAAEESGLPGLTVAPIPVQLSRHEVRCPGPAYHLDVQFLVVAGGDAEPVMSDESHDLRWFPVDRLPEGVDGVVVTLVQRSHEQVR
jgi:8-oxo-dGTP pyrophosphatase MutT (NUDIX family)